MNWLTVINARLSRWTMYLACICLAGLLIVVYGVVLRYVFNDAVLSINSNDGSR